MPEPPSRVPVRPVPPAPPEPPPFQRFAPPPAADPGPPRPAWSRESAVLQLPSVSSLDDVSPEWAWGGTRGEGIRVAVIDSGIEASHPALEGCVDVAGGVFVSVDAEDHAVVTPGPHDDGFGHGTACAGIIHSLAPAASITSVRVLGPFLGGKGAAFIAGLDWAIEQGFDVINLSLGTTKRDWALPLYELCDKAYFRNSVVVTAANNMTRESFPSLYASVLSVACNLATDPLRFHFNPEPPTEFLARGIEVDVPWLGGGRMTCTGNSFAAPHIAGLVTLIRAKHPELRPFQVKTVLWATAANVLEAPQPAGRLTTTLAEVRRTQIAQRATMALRAVGPPPPG